MLPRNVAIPYLLRNPLVVLLGPEAHLAAARLRVVAAAGGIRCIEFGDNAFVEPSQYAQIMRDTARSIGCPVLHVPSPSFGTEQAMAAAADLTVMAPSGTRNRVWLIALNAEAVSVTLPEFSVSACRFLTTLLLAGAVELHDTHLARPRVELAWPADIAVAMRAVREELMRRRFGALMVRHNPEVLRGGPDA